MQANLGTLPSYTWRSIWFAIGLLEKGLCWQIGDGKQTSIWEEAWVPGTDEYKIQYSNNGQRLVYVADLIVQHTNQWKEELIRGTFHPKDAERILCIPLPLEQEADKVIWCGEASGSEDLEIQPTARDALIAVRPQIMLLNTALQPLQYGPDWAQTEASLIKFITEYNREIGVKERIPVSTTCKEYWRPRRDTNVKINFGVAFEKQKNRSCTGMAIRFGADLGFLRVEVEGDALAIIKKLRSQEDRSEIRAYITDAKRLKRNFVTCRFNHAGRQANTVAQTLATEELKERGDTHLFSGLFSTVVRTVTKGRYREVVGSGGVMP
ncbi:cinnamoyl-CoA reductase 1-like [Gossypium australe]|uniref:Cinnamoyl-CoA reductase 1-like n=1 Tax=Gossypium australe TaxID=47621 RepID=A0A5B6UVU7_9ROSI|nr:cinnamoyl-CoA reductase 1-like [Gossypium australe]